ncbi:MAG TPA: aminotransferase class III-fold pyridoxal phosphate-dependent enzyme [Desulfomonilaceae bacterium]|nr:aminotransferase class III-fold pyridoxal phosphate-dependent enzyme [Desulfomonilaceae bacterium]
MNTTIAKKFLLDPRVAQAKAHLLQVLSEYQEVITGVRPPRVEWRKSYEEVLTEFGQLRGAPLFFSYLGSGIGKGPLVELEDGSIKYDFISGIGVHHFGHSHPAIVGALLDAALNDIPMQGNLQQNQKSVEVAKLLLSGATRNGARLEHCFFSTSGAMANENALKAIFQKKEPRSRILAFEGCFAGRTLALSQITDKSAYRVGLPSCMSVDYVPFFDVERPQESIKSSVAHLKRHIHRYPRMHAAMIFELVLGEGGFYAGTREFFVELMEVLREHDIAIMVDEIQTFSRTTELFAFQCFGLDPYVDVVTVGKSAQVCATLFRDEFNPKPGLLSQTFTASTSALYACDVIIRGLTNGDYFGPEGKIARFHDYFADNLESIGRRNPGSVSGPFGFGAMIAFTPFGGNPEKTKKLLYELFDAGVIAFYAGRDLNRIRFLLPIAAIDFTDIDAVCGILEQAMVGR